ncbi:Vacuolar protein sorting-associated protein 16 [Saguinus oedipus]|uniref:Vacuolar protein sorting-associated protein 16 homolog n=1 Tax=Saguinus oedipus TaxID=9490 RepID=A0ABQ9UNS2_SAGOE|nr:Vacuolar protein sorting-associated protein 16 [Saguinus oedipus]
MVGDVPESIQFVLDEDSYLVPELHSVCIFSCSTHEFLHEVPAASKEIFKIASIAPGVLLLEAQKEYEKESQKADEYLREIQELGQLTQAVQQCIEAAGHEYQPDMWKSLLRAASFGKCFLDRFPSDSFVRMCQDLHVLNAIRDYHIGIPLTYSQHKQLTIQVLLDRLVLRIPCHPDSLLECEPYSGDQVPLLLKMKRSKLVLSKAIESGDTDLVFTVLLHLKNELNQGDFIS